MVTADPKDYWNEEEEECFLELNSIEDKKKEQGKADNSKKKYVACPIKIDKRRECYATNKR